MAPEELYTFFRSEVGDTVEPYLWTDEEVWGYMDWAHTEFVRLMGGITDSTSPLTQLEVAEGEEFSPYDERILKFRRAKRLSDQRRISVVTFHDADQHFSCDYGMFNATGLDDTVGTVSAMVIGMEEHQVRWVNIPDADDMVQCTVYRLPLCTLSGEAGEKFEIRSEYHRDLLHGMRHKALLKQDAEVFDRGRAKEAYELFQLAAERAAQAQSARNQAIGTTRYGGI